MKQTMNRRFDAILIDFYGTISAGDREAVAAVCARIVKEGRFRIEAEEFALCWGRRFFEVIEQSNHEKFRTLYECEKESLQQTMRALGRELDPVPFVEQLEAYWANPPMYADAIDFLRRIDLPICCVSNADTKPLLAAVEKNGLRFDALVSSEMVRCYKPSPAIFQQAAQTMGVPPDRLVHVGDSLHSDVGGASQLGITTVWIRRESRIHDIGTCPPDHTITRLDQLLPLPGQASKHPSRTALL